MNTPPFLFAAALLFWGWQTGYLVFAVAMAAALEGARLVRRRWELSPGDFYRIADLCALSFLAMYAFRYLADTATMSRWLPFVCFPLVLAQSLSTAGGVDLGAIFYTERRKEKKRTDGTRKTADVSWPSFVLVLLSASAANVRSPAFYIGIFSLAAWALWSVRPPKRSAVVWAVVMIAVGAAGWAGHSGLRRLHLAADEAALQWYMANRAAQRNPLRNVTAIGEVGTLKRSNRIVMRVKAETPLPGPQLLREASYNIYRAGRWMAADAGFYPVAGPVDSGNWQLNAGGAEASALTVTANHPEGDGFLSVPMDAAVVEDLPARRVEKNRFGAIRVLQGPELVEYRVKTGALFTGDAPPSAVDLEIPEKQASAVRRAAESLSLDGLSPQRAVERVSRFFRDRFSYSLTQERRRWGVLPLEQFLFDTRSGHCEFFATATVLLLRAAGVPARYAVGYQVTEFSRLERRYLVRSRHAHAWAQAFVDGRWRIVDTTPSRWAEIEEDAATVFEPAIDLFRWIGHQVNRWRQHGAGEGLQRILTWLLVPLVLILVWRIVFQKRTSTMRGAAARNEKSASEGADASRLAPIDARLSAEGFERGIGETQLCRLRRLSEAGADPAAVAGLGKILTLHYRDRFHPDGIDAAAAADLDARIAAWLAPARTSLFARNGEQIDEKAPHRKP